MRVIVDWVKACSVELDVDLPDNWPSLTEAQRRDWLRKNTSEPEHDQFCEPQVECYYVSYPTDN